MTATPANLIQPTSMDIQVAFSRSAVTTTEPLLPNPEVLSSDDNTATDIDHILQSLSDERALELLPVFVVFALVFVLGILGNTLTVYIYSTKFKATWSRTAIVALGTFDLISCLVAVPGEVLDLRYSFNYHSDGLCRALRASATFPNVASGIMLTTVAFDRYRLICTPHRTSMSKSRAWKHVLGVCLVSLMVTWPAAIVYGTMEIDTRVGNVTGTECSTSDLVKHTKYPLVYNLVLAFVFLFAFVAMIVFYFMIGQQIYRQGEFRKTLMNMRDHKRKNTQSELEASVVSDQDGWRENSQSSESHRHSAYACENSKDDGDSKSRDSQPRSPTSPTSQNAPFQSRRKLSRSSSVIQRIRKSSFLDSRTRKTTLMLCFISIVFVLSFLPHLAVKLCRVFDKEFLDNASTARLVVYNLCARSYFLNSFINVFIYGFCSFRFRQECRKALKKLLLWKCCR